MFQDFISLHNFFFFNDTATTEIYTLSYTTLFRSARIPLLGRAMVTAGHLTIDRAHPARALEAYQRSEEHTSELQSLAYLVCRLLLEKKNALIQTFFLIR